MKDRGARGIREAARGARDVVAHGTRHFEHESAATAVDPKDEF